MKLLFLAFILFTTPAYTLELSGTFAQGGLVIGKAESGTIATFGKTQVITGKDGIFIFGINRNHPIEAKLVLTTPAGELITQKDLIISPKEYKTQKITGIAKRKVNPNPIDMVKIQNDKKQIRTARAKYAELPHLLEKFIIPTIGKFSGVYGSQRWFNGQERSWHKGLDIVAKTGSPVIAPAGGVVRLALKNSFFNGNLVILDHGHQLMTVYAHLNKIHVKVGQKITQGDLLGTVGMTGRATGPHLHWGLYWRNMALDPTYLLEKSIL